MAVGVSICKRCVDDALPDEQKVDVVGEGDLKVSERAIVVRKQVIVDLTHGREKDTLEGFLPHIGQHQRPVPPLCCPGDGRTHAAGGAPQMST
jgi:hypothetical protein